MILSLNTPDNFCPSLYKLTTKKFKSVFYFNYYNKKVPSIQFFFVYNILFCSQQFIFYLQCRQRPHIVLKNSMTKFYRQNFTGKILQVDITMELNYYKTKSRTYSISQQRPFCKKMRCCDSGKRTDNLQRSRVKLPRGPATVICTEICKIH